MNFEKRWFGFALVVFAIVLLQSCTPSQAKEKTPLKKSYLSTLEQALIDEYKYIIEEQFQLGNAPTGMAVAIVKDGKILMQVTMPD